MGSPGVNQLMHAMEKEKNVHELADGYLNYFNSSDDEHEQTERRKKYASEIANKYYDLASDFYEYGWGECFHFSTLGRNDTREQAIAKHQHRLALKLGLQPTDTVLDMGCGIGGPGREISKFSGAKVVGLNNNAYQIKRAEELTKKAGLEDSCSYVEGNFLHAPFTGASFDKVYAIQATCYAPDLLEAYSEAYRLLKPGGMFGLEEWVITDKYNANNPQHKKIKLDILEGDGLPELHTASHALHSLKKAGFEIMDEEDLALKSEVPWYTVLQAKWTVSDLKITSVGRWLTHLALVTMETVGLAPRGSVSTHRMLCKGADGLTKGGKEGIFTPLYFVLAKKPST